VLRETSFASLPSREPPLWKWLFGNRAPQIPGPAVQAFQKYYRRAAVQRGYGSEGPRDTLLLMVEEVGELARAIRKKEGLKRHGRAIREDEGLELADVFIYVVHLANVLGVNLSQVVKQKELLNIQKLLRHPTAK
jgi:NTP pyrophosphatase (non-canonical NTP hydrolase)